MSNIAEIARATVARRGAPSTAALLQIPAAMIVLTALVAVVANSYWLVAITSAFAVSLAAAGVAVVYGQLGLVSLCQYALVGVGGWVTLRIGHAFHPPFEVSLLAGGLASGLVGIVFGLPALRLKGLYLAIVTLMLAGLFQVLVSAWGFPDGGDGFLGRAQGLGRKMLEGPAISSTPTAYFVYVAAFATAAFVVVQWHRMAKPGRAWALIRKGEHVALAAGVNLLRYKVWAFALSGFLAGISGALLVGNVGQLDARAFTAPDSLTLFALSVVGGVFNWYGALIAGLLLRAVPSLLTDLGVNGYVTLGIFGAALFQALSTAPTGIAGQISGLVARLLKGRLRGGDAP